MAVPHLVCPGSLLLGLLTTSGAAEAPLGSFSFLFLVQLFVTLLVGGLCLWLVLTRMKKLQAAAGSGSCTNETVTPSIPERRIRGSEERFRQLANSLPQIVWTSTADGVVNYYNERWYEYTGLPFATQWEKSVHPEELQTCKELLAESIREGKPYEAEIRLRRAKDGAYRWHLARAVPITRKDGTIESWFGTSTDIDDFKNTSAELQKLNESLEREVQERSARLAESERQYRLLLGGVRDYAILMLDTAGRVVSWNLGAERILGYTADEIVGKHFSMFSAEEEMSISWEHELAIARETGRFEEEGWRMNKSGVKFWANVVVTPVYNDDGTLQGFSKVTRDISERKAAEDLVKKRNEQVAQANIELSRQTERAEEANRAKSSFLAAMSHEIRTPMNAILGMADLLWETQLSEAQRDYVGRFRRAGSNLLTLINDILDFSKIEAGHFELEAVQFDLFELIDRTTELMEPRAKAKNIALSTRVMPGTPRCVVGDPARLQQILNNLIGNAVKFTDRGSVVLTVKNHADGVPGHLEVEVKDTGIGIPADKILTIFEDFIQADSSTARRFGGTGLGLGICTRLVNRMGGELTVNSEVDKGSKFLFDLFVSIGEAAPETHFSDLVDFTGCRILIVDDNSTNRLILRKMCSGWGMRADEAESALGAVEKITEALAAQDAFSLVLLDCTMPETAGIEALGDLLRLDAELRVILISSDAKPGEATRASALGASAYVSKPVRSAELLALVSAALRGAKRRRPKESTQAEMTGESGGDAMKILIADDSEDNRFLLAAYLKSSFYEITFAENGREALEMFERQRFDLVLMDVHMPVMDGLSATTAIRTLEERRGLRATPIVALTANALVEDTERSRAAGCNSHLSKPISKDKLVSAIESFRPPLKISGAATLGRALSEQHAELTTGVLA